MRKGSDSLSINQHLRVIRPHLAVLLNANNNEWKTQLAVLNKFVLTTYNNNKQKIFTQSENINIMVEQIQQRSFMNSVSNFLKSNKNIFKE